MMISDSDVSYMQQALELARRGLGRTAPNPVVGCVIVRDGDIVGQGRTADGGRPHAEVTALAEAGDLAVGADVYVTLEPCQNCSRALIEAGVARVYVACQDENPAVKGRGVALLQETGIGVYEGLLWDEAYDFNRGFFLTKTENRPLVSLKMAVSADGKIAGGGGARVQISGVESHAHMHRVLRARHDAIAVGVGTVIADNPILTTRIDGVDHQSLRVVLGDSNRVPKTCHLAGQNDVVVMGNHDIATVLQILSLDHGVTRLLVEGGALVMQAFLESGLWDDLYLYRSSLVIGEDGVDVPDFSAAGEPVVTEKLGDDVFEVYKRR